MSKFGSLNNFQLTREAYNLKEKMETVQQNITKIEDKTNEIANNVFEVNEMKIKEFIEGIDKTIDMTSLKRRIELLEKKTEKRKLYSIQISEEEKEHLQNFLNNNNLENMYSALIELGVRNIEDILFLNEYDLIPYGFTIILIRKCLNSAKAMIETNQM
jgi:hypothetical protein